MTWAGSWGIDQVGDVLTVWSTDMRRSLTPYDRGDRLEPVPWVRGQVALPSSEEGLRLPRRPADDDYGRVDFDDEESATVLTIHVLRTGEGHTVVIESHGEPLGAGTKVVLDGVILTEGGGSHGHA